MNTQWPILLLLSGFFLFGACQNKNAETNQPQQVAPPANSPPRNTSAPAVLFPNIDHLRLRAEPTTTSKVVASLRLGDTLFPTGTLSAFTSEIILRGIRFKEPWVQVKTSAGSEGWVFGGALSFPPDPLPPVANQLLEFRIEGFFGEELAPSVLAYRKAFMEARSDREVAKAYRQGLALRDTLLDLIERKIPVLDYESLPDLFWLEQALPGYLPSLAAEGTIYYLFNDYRQWAAKAQKSIGKYDDAFMELAIEIYQPDSIGYFFPVWFRQTWDYGGHSNLGSGIHLKILQQIDVVMKQGLLFAEPLATWKKDILHDITSPENTYWYDQQAILQELDQLMVTELAILDQGDRVALEVRRKQFADPQKFEISLNQRSGQ